ncbi:hypothetical protein CEXT_743001 [Caerostris extrusa]|uniref:Uncharacterized protein n=1 Tax=Caerostris extrusa TaxID=172846 RepID=A0AAV4W024_CAEEX|nr:hypothetical protein CEXT_743001 [Caerostris extrusa]
MNSSLAKRSSSMGKFLEKLEEGDMRAEANGLSDLEQALNVIPSSLSHTEHDKEDKTQIEESKWIRQKQVPFDDSKTGFFTFELFSVLQCACR